MSRQSRVAEFRVLREWSRLRKINLWMIGGAAATFANYVKWNLEGATAPGVPLRAFDYTWEDIFYSTQDLDLVTDGSDQDARDLETLVTEQYPYAKGIDRTFHVVRISGIEGRHPFIERADFLGQHSDTMSLGMVELTTDEPRLVTRDLLDWNAQYERRVPAFLSDVADARVHFRFSPEHRNTHRAREGVNPPILSVFRILIKALHFGQEIDREGFERMKGIVADWRITLGGKYGNQLSDTYETAWISSNAPKLFLNSMDVSRTRHLLKEVGLWDKLRDFARIERFGAGTGSIPINAKPVGSKAPDSLWEWTELQPLTARPVGQGDGATAAVLGIGLVSVTPEYTAFFEHGLRGSRQPVSLFSEQAGGQVEKRRRPGYGVLWFEPLPEARAGSDFLLDGGKLTILNSAAFRQPLPSREVSPLEFFKVLAEGRFNREGYYYFTQSREMAMHNLGRAPVTAEYDRYVERIRRQVKGARLSTGDRAEIDAFVAKALRSTTDARILGALAQEYLGFFEKTGSHEVIRVFIFENFERMLITDHSSGDADLIPVLETWLSNPVSAHYATETFKRILATLKLSQGERRRILGKSGGNIYLNDNILHYFGLPHWTGAAGTLDFLGEIVAAPKTVPWEGKLIHTREETLLIQTAARALRSPGFANLAATPEGAARIVPLLVNIFEMGDYAHTVSLLAVPEYARLPQAPTWFRKIMDAGQNYIGLASILAEEVWALHPDDWGYRFWTAMRGKGYDENLAGTLRDSPAWLKHPKYRELLERSGIGCEKNLL